MSRILRFDVKRSCALLILSFITFSTAAQYTYPSLKLTHFTDADGLSSNLVTCMMQDHLGFIWIGTDDGLNRFDGVTFQIYKKQWDDTNSLASNNVIALAEDSMHRVWIGTYEGLCYLDQGSNVIHRLQIPNVGLQQAWALLIDGPQRLWIGTKEYVCRFDLRSKKFTVIKLSNEQTYQWLNRSACLYLDRNGILFNGGWDGVYRIDTAKCSVISYSHTHTAVMTIRHCDANHLWVGTWGDGMLRFNLRENKPDAKLLFPPDEKGLNEYVIAGSITPASNDTGHYWVTSNHGILFADRRTLQYVNHYSYETGVSSSEISYLKGSFCDRDGNFWIYSEKGFAKLDQRQQVFRLYDLTSEKVFGAIENIIASGNDAKQVYITLWPRGFLQYDLGKQRIVHHWLNEKGDVNRETYIFSSMMDADHHLWLGSNQGGLFRFDQPGNAIHHFREKKFEDQNLKNIVYVLAPDSSHHLWLASKAGLAMFDLPTSTFHYYPHYDTTAAYYFGDHRVFDILLDRNQNIWCVSHTDGIFIYHSVQKTFEKIAIYAADGSKIEDIRSPQLARDREGTIWLATEYGLFRFNSNQHAFVTTVNDLPGDKITGMYIDQHDTMWLSFGSKILRYDFRTNEKKEYSPSQGLADEDIYNIGKVEGSDVRFSGYHGKFILFNPLDLSPGKNDHPIRLTSVYLLGNDSLLNTNEGANTLHLQYEQNDIRFDYRLLDYGDPANTQYAYMLKGLDNHWNNTGNINSAVFTHLREGDYRLLVKAANADGIWTEPVQLASFSITPPYWRTTAFRVAVLLLTGATLFSFYDYRRRQRRKLAVVRERIARDLHDDVGSTLSSIRMTSALARKKISEDRSRTAELLDKINDSSTRMTENMQDIVWAVNPDNDSFERLIARMQQFAAQSFEARNIELHFSAGKEMKSLKIPLEYRRDFFLIYKEAVNNVSKYSGARLGKISITKNHHFLQLTIEDDGIGFREEAILPGNGLRNMRNRAKNLNGTFHIHSEEGKGTKVILELKI